jgi:hypothetical protein
LASCHTPIIVRVWLKPHTLWGAYTGVMLWYEQLRTPRGDVLGVKQ